jgi:hypothetical protein
LVFVLPREQKRSQKQTRKNGFSVSSFQSTLFKLPVLL